MLLALAIPAGVVSAVAYGVGTAVQHTAVQAEATGGAGLARLLRSPRWWASIAGDGFGLVLQLIALATGPVVLIQPLFILCLPVALPVRARLGGRPPTRRDYLWSLVLCAGLGAFFLVAGRPHTGGALTTSTAVTAIAVSLGSGLVLALGSRLLRGTSRAVVISAIAGAWFGTEAMLVNGVSTVWSSDGLSAFTHLVGLVPLVGAVVLGLLGFAFSQAAFQHGSIGAALPAMLVVDPLVAVLTGAFLLGEGVRADPLAVLGYALSAAVVVYATFRLALGGDRH